ncbi:hypothetical protein A2U01_0115824, partial [Trifolium medium]|nr:hypothetical protein [Trifolium medium]
GKKIQQKWNFAAALGALRSPWGALHSPAADLLLCLSAAPCASPWTPCAPACVKMGF